MNFCSKLFGRLNDLLNVEKFNKVLWYSRSVDILYCSYSNLFLDELYNNASYCKTTTLQLEIDFAH
jgi:hypothetical protein